MSVERDGNRRRAEQIPVFASGRCDGARLAKSGSGSVPGKRKPVICCDIVEVMALSKTPCEERERLQRQFEDLRRAETDLESRLCSEIVSGDHSVRARAKNELARAANRAFHVMMELTDHEKKHGCVSYKKPHK
jgi:hypothetical protein